MKTKLVANGPRAALSANRASHRGADQQRYDLGAYFDSLREQGVLKTYTTWIGLALLLSVIAFNSEKLAALFDHPIRHVEVTGEFKNLDVSELSAALQPWVDSSFLATDLQEVKALVESFAWVKTATVSRVWPGRLVVNIEEQVAAANWGDASLLNIEGDVFTPEKIVWLAGRPTLTAPANTSKAGRVAMLNKMKDLQSILHSYELEPNHLVLRSRGVWELGLVSGPHIELGAEPFEDKLERAVRVYGSLAPDAQLLVDRIDSRYPNGVAVSWKSLDIAALGQHKVGFKK